MASPKAPDRRRYSDGGRGLRDARRRSAGIHGCQHLQTNIDKGLKDLRDKRLLPVDFDKVSSVELTGPKLSLTFGPEGKTNGKWIVQNPKDVRVDSAKLEDVVDKLRLATMDPGAADADTKKAASCFPPAARWRPSKLRMHPGSQEIQIRKNKDDYYAKSTAMDGVYKVSNELGADINKSTEDFREKWLLDLRDDSPDKVEMHVGAKIIFSDSRPASDCWSADGKKMDPLSVDDFLGKIRDFDGHEIRHDRIFQSHDHPDGDVE